MSFANTLAGNGAAGWSDRAAQHAAEKAQASAADGVCPHCQQPLADESHLPEMLRGALRLLLSAVTILAAALLRLVRFAAGAALCLVGQLGAWCRSLGMKVVHPADRQLLSTVLLQSRRDPR